MANDTAEARNVKATLAEAAMSATMPREAVNSFSNLGLYTASIRRQFFAALYVVLTALKGDELDLYARRRIEAKRAALDRAARIRHQFKS